jgi:predicted dehydrogenase
VKRPISHALIGAGGFGRAHLDTLSALEQHGEVRLSAVCDPGIHRMDDIKADLVARGVRLYEDYSDMLEKEDGLDAVSIATPVPYHFRMAEACLKKDLFIYLEKPPVPMLEQWRVLADADTGNRIAIGFQLIEFEWSQRLKQCLVEGRFGELQEIRGTACWARGNGYYQRANWAGRLMLGDEPVFDGPATNALAHLVHEIMFLAGANVESFAVPSTIEAALFRGQPIESYDTAFIRGNLRDAAKFRVAVSHSCATDHPYEIHVIGSKAWVKVTESGEIVESTPDLLGLDQKQEYPFERAYRTFLGYVRGEQSRASTMLRDTLGYLATTNGMLASSEGIHAVPGEYVNYDQAGDRYAIDQLMGSMVDFLESGELVRTNALHSVPSMRTISVPELCRDGVLPLLRREVERAAAAVS